MTNPNRALQVAAEHLQVRLVGNIKYGSEEKSVGSTIVSSDGMRAWLRIQYKEKEKAVSNSWTGIHDAECISGVMKPSVIQSTEWEYDQIVWHADLMTCVTTPVCSRTPELRESLALTRDWWKDLRLSLGRLARVSTKRVNVTQELITRRIREYFDTDIDTTISIWQTVHGDLHWANVTQPDCWILDWEGWGIGPQGLDSAILYCFSLLTPEIAGQVASTFKDEFETRDAALSQLFVCAELIRMSEKFGDHPDLVPLLFQHAEQLLHRLRFREHTHDAALPQ